MAASYPNEKKTLWEKEKLLVTSNFSFSHSVFKRHVSQGRQKVSLCGNGLTCYHTIPTFKDPLPPIERTFESNAENGENDVNQHFLLFPQCFLTSHKQVLVFNPRFFCGLQML